MDTHESYVSLETAKLLKEAGFDWNCQEYYDKYGVTTYCSNIPFDIQAWKPTLSIAQRWLREVKGLQVFVYSISQESWHWHILNPHQDIKDGLSGEDYDTYEEALEAGINKCLTLLLN